MAEAHVVERVDAAHPLVAGLDVDRVVALRRRDADVRVEVRAVDVGVEAVERVDDRPEPLEVHVDDVVDVQAGERLDRLRGEVRPAERERVVDLRRPVAGDQHLQVARQRQHRRRLLVGVEPDEHQRVRARLVAVLLVDPAAVGADEQDRLRVAGLGRRVDRLDVRSGRGLARLRLDLRVEPVVELEQRRGRARARGQQDDQERREERLEQHPAVRARSRAHASPPSTARRSGVSAGTSPASRAGRPSMKSLSARR